MADFQTRAAELASLTPSNFIFGTATSSWQIEGSSKTRGSSIWDDFAAAGLIKDGSTADPACDHIRLLESDLDLLTWLGVDAYRFSISWPRILPAGGDQISAAGIDFYDRLIDGLLQRGIKPALTIYHWDLPSELEAKGGWTWSGITDQFANYTQVLAEKFADRVDMWSTLNEPWVSSFLGYATNIHAPGRNDAAAGFKSAYYLMLAHGKAMEVLRDFKVNMPGIVLNLTSVIGDTEIEPARSYIDLLQNRFWLNLLAGRGLENELLENTKHITAWDFVDSAELDLISKPIDWLGINYYTPTRISAVSSDKSALGQDLSLYPGTPGKISFTPLEPRTEMGWEIHAPSLLTTLQQTSSRLPNVPLYITENGGAFPDKLVAGKVNDQDRVDYYYNHIKTALSAIPSGIDLRGYLAWSLIDNVEWAEGISKRFGIFYNDFTTQQRTPKLSAEFIRAINLARRVNP